MLAGMGLLLFANIMDLTDNYESLNRFVVVGDTPVQAFLEKIVGFSGGFLLLTIGLLRWMPTVTGVDRIEQLNRELKAEIATREHAQHALKKSEAFLNATGQMARVGGWELTLDPWLLCWTDETKRIHDLPMEYSPSLDAAIQFYHPEDRPKMQEAVQRCIENGESFDMQLRVITAKGRDIHIQAIGRPHVAGGKTIKLSGTFQDITERWRVENQLRDANENLKSTSTLLQNIIESIPARVFWKDCHSRYLGCNTLFARDAGFSSADALTGKTDYDLGWKDLAELYRADDKSITESGISKLNYEEPQTTPEGKTIWLRTSKVVLRDSDNEVIGVLGIYNDITEQKQLESDLIAARDQAEKINELLSESTARANEMAIRAEAANQAKSQFLANMSHEIRTPMNSIIGFSDMLAEETLTHEQKQEVDNIRRAGRNLLNLINDILDCSKIEAGELSVEMIDCALGQLLNAVESMMVPLVKEKAIVFKIMTSSDLPVQIHSDPYRLNQCLVNLLSNAIKFTDEGHVYLKVSLREDNHQHFIQFDVEDTGIGIAKDRHQAIFDSFTQADGSTARQYGGTGLGLTVTRQLTKLMGGELSLISEPGQGSVFSLVIPVGTEILGQPSLNRDHGLEQAAHDSQHPDTIQFSGRVLVAEDVESNQVLMTLTLSRLGVDVVIAQDGNEVLQKVLSQSFDLILMDMQMPCMNGYEATGALRQQGYKMPIVALTANAMKGDDRKCLEVGCDDYLTKPIDRRDLPQMLAKYLSVRPDSMNQTIDLMPEQPCDPQAPGSEPRSSTSQPGSPDDADPGDIIRWDQLIDRMGDEATVREIMPLYIQDIQKHYAALSEAVKLADCESLASCAHALKGVGRNLSVERLFDITGQMEHAGRANDIEAGTLLFGSLRQEIERLLTALSRPDWIERVKNAQPLGPAHQ
ncbi:MAG: response regulator [Phycisphaerae bacterium]|nr:response regulator [Phycisphaerae bacterium]